MRWRQAARYWHDLGARNPFGVILTGADDRPRDWESDEFFRTGAADAARVCAELTTVAPDLPRRTANRLVVLRDLEWTRIITH